MSKCTNNKRSIPHERSVENIHKYFKPLNDLSNQIIPTQLPSSSSKPPSSSESSSSSEIQQIYANDAPTNNTSEFSQSIANTSLLVDKISHLSMNNEKIALCNSFKHISIAGADSIISDEPVMVLQSNVDIQSFDTSVPDRSNGISLVVHGTSENNELNQRDILSTHLLQIEFYLKSCQNLIKESTRPDIPHKAFVEKTQAFVIELKKILDPLDATCREQIENINVEFSNIDFISTKSTDKISRDPAYSSANGKFTEEELRYLVHKGPMQPVLKDYPKNVILAAQNATCKFASKWFNEYPMLEYSQTTDKVYCFACRLFYKGPGSEKVDLAWIKTGVQSWSKMKGRGKDRKGKLDQHFTSSSHLASMYRLSVFKNKYANVECLMDANNRLANQKEESILKINTKIIETFFDCTLFLAKQGLAFRRDPQEHGNFIQLIHLLRRYDPLLNSWFTEEKFKSHHISYTSARSQDKFIEHIGNYVIGSIVQQVQNAPFYSVMIDSTPDCSHREIYSLVIRYVDNDLNVHERVICLKELPSKTGQSICDFILHILHNYHISTDCLIGQCYDNAPNMSGCRRGVQNCMKIALKRDIIHIPCGGHTANLAVKHACECSTEYIRFFDLIEEISVFFTSSINRYHTLRTQINSSTSALTVKNLSITRWSANYESINAICRSIPEITNTFKIIINNIDDKIINNTDDKLTLDDKKTKQQECDDQVLSNGVDIDSEFSRYHHQRLRSIKNDSNYKTGVRLNRVEYYKKLMIEILDYIVISLTDYHKVVEEKLQHFSTILPGRINHLTLANANKITEIVPSISSAEILFSELQLLKNDIDGVTELPEFINKFKLIANGYPNAKRVYQFILALPITVATNERSFSKLKLIKSRLRSNLMPDKAEWLIIASTERDLLENIDLSKFAQEWSRLKNRRGSIFHCILLKKCRTPYGKVVAMWPERVKYGPPILKWSGHPWLNPSIAQFLWQAVQTTTVDEDRILKYLFHGIRYLNIAEQLIRTKCIYDFRQASYILFEMKDISVKNNRNIDFVVDYIRTCPTICQINEYNSIDIQTFIDTQFKGLDIIRVKIKSLALNNDVPENDLDKMLFWDNKSNYFEFYHKVLTKSLWQLHKLKNFCRNRHLHLASFGKISGNEGYYFVILRLFNVGREKALIENDYLLKCLTANYFPPLDIENLNNQK
ncbi:unnamed protein product [Adineta steineri]|uniref:TTF-type domain-containing protein n=1 Tax=Adineta steineri TaxID=433720 RepID=A0A814MN76_9BILA|nr:unnamed protein product [Adineta steineri]CAF1081747.1 unnamed protein product [Adineta steineri]